MTATISIPYEPAALTSGSAVGSLLSMARRFLATVFTPAVTPAIPVVDDTSQETRFLSLIRQEESTISAICFSYSGSVAEYDDLRQDALLTIWRGMAGFKGESSPRTWIYRVVLNSCVSTIRRQSRHSRESESLDKLYDLVSDEPSEDRERIETLHRLISKLNAEDKAMILMWLDEASYDDISAVMGLPRNTVATRLRRIKEKLSRQASTY